MAANLVGSLMVTSLTTDISSFWEDYHRFEQKNVMAITEMRFSRAYWACFKLLDGSAGGDPALLRAKAIFRDRHHRFRCRGWRSVLTMKRKIGFAFIAAAIGFWVILVAQVLSLAQAKLGQGNTHTERASAGLAFQVLQPVY